MFPRWFSFSTAVDRAETLAFDLFFPTENVGQQLVPTTVLDQSTESPSNLPLYEKRMK